MATVLDDLKAGNIPERVKRCAVAEGVETGELVENILNGHVSVPLNRLNRSRRPVAIGKASRVKVNANVGTSPIRCDMQYEMEKVRESIESGADTIMDLSISGDIGQFRRDIREQFDIPLGTVPVYEAMLGCKGPEELNIDRFLRVMEKQAKDGVDFMTIHAGLLKKHIPLTRNRVTGVVSRGGSILMKWIEYHDRENFLYEYFDKILQIAREYDITISLGDGLRPGCTGDANDAAQFGELEIIGELVFRCREENVQVIVEGPGHVPIHLIRENIVRQKEICEGAPFYLLGPLVMDYAPGYDHISGAIGGALAAYFGADFLCYVTPAEHLRLPTLEDVREGVIASKIAAASADLARGVPSEIKRNRDMSRARFRFDWETQGRLSLDPKRFASFLEKDEGGNKQDGMSACTMCGEWCAIKRQVP